MDVAAISSAYTGVKAAKEVFTAVLALKIDNESMLKVNDALQRLGQVQDSLFEVREQLAELQSRNEELQRKLNDQEAWAGVLAKYKLESTAGGAVVYASLSEPKHFVCPSCIGKRELHILQDARSLAGNFNCPGCGFSYPIAPQRRLPPMQANTGSII